MTDTENKTVKEFYIHNPYTFFEPADFQIIRKKPFKPKSAFTKNDVLRINTF